MHEHDMNALWTAALVVCERQLDAVEWVIIGMSSRVKQLMLRAFTMMIH